MKAMVLKQFGGVENFRIENIPKPKIQMGDVLVKVKAVGVDMIDIKSRKGEGMRDILSKEYPMILGWDISGVVERVGDEVKDFHVGDEVFGVINFPGPGSSYAEYVAAPAAQLAIKPKNISHTEAAAATQSPLTAWQAMVETGHLKKGERVLIHGGAGGVGNYAVQIARILGCYVITTVAGEDSRFARELGADEVIDYKTQKFEELMGNIDFVLETIGGENFVRSLKVLKPEGSIVLLPSNKKEEADKVAKEQHIKHYSHILMHSSGEGMRQIADMLAKGKMKVYLDQIFPFECIPEAHKLMEEGNVKGKIAITMD